MSLQTDKSIEFIVSWLKNYAVTSKMNGFVVGVSGGIDSALTSTLCAKTGLPTLCIEMPIKQDSKQVSRSSQHTHWLAETFDNIERKVVALDDVFSSFEQLNSNQNHINHKLSLANSRARLRMTTLYYFAALDKRLVAGTGNKVEDFGVGFYTKYGDGGVDVSPIADLLKSEVRILAQALGINKSILEAAPTDGLWDDGRTDEDQLGATYPELEWAMAQIDAGRTINNFEGRQKKVMTTYLNHHNVNKHKMIPIPVCALPEDLR